MPTIVDEIRAVFRSAGVEGFLHARPVVASSPEVAEAKHGEVDINAGNPVILASVFKIPFVVAYAREVAAGRLDPEERTTVTARDRIGGVGTAGCADDVEMSWRDLATFMMTMSDNAATDIIYRRVGQERIQAVLDDLGLTGTRIVGCCADLFASMADDLGVGLDGLGGALADATPERIRKLAILDPSRTSATTPRDTTTLLAAIWTGAAAPEAACADVRSIMAQQIWPHRLSSGFPDEVDVAGKTGTLPGVRNEAGVVSYPDGQKYAVAVFTRTDVLDYRLPQVDAAIGTAARLAVEHLRR
ncbi:serine hydrolase [Phytoactinopolyspora mesophila]|uniref:Serine hydrolase n=1 Tax=Phytoactinopolyspora mesophila TaxID=2650750 RepID=A0A7K3M6J6_9ACTN|nr:serine hydrolase [Phytoactinopolyspora mesophila]